ncbi:unnamed protein product [Discosporangium mesarthrocarpum]
MVAVSWGGGGGGGRPEAGVAGTDPNIRGEKFVGSGQGVSELPPNGKAEGKGKWRKKGLGGGNANHLLNFQFQPLTGQGGSGGGGGGGEKGSKAGGGGGWHRRGGGGGGARVRGGVRPGRGPMSREQFLQANFEFLLHGPEGQLVGLQEGFFNPDVLVDWETVDTVRLTHVHNNATASGQEHPPDPESTANSNQGSQELGLGLGLGLGRGQPATGRNVTKSPPPSTPSTLSTWGTFSTNAGGKRCLNDQEPVESAARKPQGRGKEEVEEEVEEDGWRCPICLERPTVPRVTKCGHGPFCFVCILRHLDGETSRRCPLCFETMHREQLRRAGCKAVVRHKEGGEACFVLLTRDHSSLIPHTASYSFDKSSTELAESSRLSGLPAGVSSSHTRGPAAESAEDPCLESSSGLGLSIPCEGQPVSRFSRLVLAQPSLLLARTESEVSMLQRFRGICLRDGDTEWLPYVSQAQSLLSDRLLTLTTYPNPNPIPHGLPPQNSNAKRQGKGKGKGKGKVMRSKEEEMLGQVCQGDAKSSGNDTIGLGLASADEIDGMAGQDWSKTRSSSSPHTVQSGPLPIPTDQARGGISAVKYQEGKEGKDPNPRDGNCSNDRGGNSLEAVPAPYRFYQSDDGQKAFLHPFNMRCLLEDCGGFAGLPLSLEAPILEVETVKMTLDLRKRLPYLGHLPEHCDITLVELDLDGLLSEEVKEKFHEGISKRQRKRLSRKAQEEKMAAREAKAEAKRIARMASMRMATVDLMGPLPGAPPSPRYANLVNSSGAKSSEGNGSSDGTKNDVHKAANASAAANIYSNPDEEGGAGHTSLVDVHTASERSVSDSREKEEAGWSFARVTAMNGHFPSLRLSGAGPWAGDDVGKELGGGGHMAAGSEGAWGVGGGGGINGNRQGGSSGVPKGVWGAKPARAAEQGQGQGMESQGWPSPVVSSSDAGDGKIDSAGSKKLSRKNKAAKGVALLSNAGVRRGR